MALHVTPVTKPVIVKTAGELGEADCLASSMVPLVQARLTLTALVFPSVNSLRTVNVVVFRVSTIVHEEDLRSVIATRRQALSSSA